MNGSPAHILPLSGSLPFPSSQGLTRGSSRQQAQEGAALDCRVKPGNDAVGWPAVMMVMT